MILKITLSKNAGFCPGVRRADDGVMKLICESDDSTLIFTLGELIHNKVYVKSLEEKGVRAINLNEAERVILDNPGKKIVFVIRTHGIPKPDEEYLRALAEEHEGVSVLDMTCPYVKKIHDIAARETGDDTYFLLYGSRNHPECIGTISYAKGDRAIISNEEELKSIDFKGKIPILCAQTTQNLLQFIKFKNFLKKVCTNAIFFDTICNVTENRQYEAIELAKRSDAMIVIGGKQSSNTEKLYHLCKEVCPKTLWVETAAELSTDFPDSAKSAGITAGASTPDGIIMEVFKAMENFSQMLEGSLKTLHTGETVTGTVFTIGQNEIKLDLGAKFTGVLTKEQITDDPDAKLAEMFKVGDEVEVFVIRVEDGKGIATVSKKRVDKDNSWVVLKEAFDNKEDIEGKVISAIKGGVLVSYAANNVFVPASQTGIAKGGDLSVLVGTTQKVRLLEFDVDKKRALGSIKAILNEEKAAKEAAIWATLEVGKHYMGTVKNLTNYGAFVDIGGVDGMVHNSELSWKRIKHPSQVLSVGQEIDVFIKELDTEKKRISLGYKTQEMDSWFKFTQQYKEGDVVSAKIVSIMPFGAFAEVFEDVDGLIHISRISTERINSPADVLKVGDVVDVKITEIDDENRRLALSIRALKEAEERAAAEAARAAEKAQREAEEAAEAERLAQERADMAPYIVGSI
ncbi:MAG: bifunctional 4-hydroxy-3-methylbut-2-enyl diphosphate reductase/30S ribosomal protein S1 [Ruminococcaceae bacterium]|nr:bifunctional 4-hydroxy-3-methylbut-2-enyl diphosphate reductase/30S ribosomal protein S1 [Oscillospiraceae bacterium]